MANLLRALGSFSSTSFKNFKKERKKEERKGEREGRMKCGEREKREKPRTYMGRLNIKASLNYIMRPSNNNNN